MELGRRHLLLNTLEENTFFSADVPPEALAEPGQPFLETRHGIALHVPNLRPHVVVLVNKATRQLGSIADVLRDGGE